MPKFYSRKESPTRYALKGPGGAFLSYRGDTTDPREALSFLRPEQAADTALSRPGYRPVAIRVGELRCYSCNGAGQWVTGINGEPDGYEVCSNCDGHGWIPRKPWKARK
jgi:hypothetical protein